ncbi:5'-methylthioadenosine/S-adenosylhomocysteine nucleosidase family protein [Nonomuraea sp. NPDC002799]
MPSELPPETHPRGTAGSDRLYISFWAAREAATAVRRAERCRDVADVIRPRGIFGVLRSRAPVAIILYVAARDGRLVWQSPEAFAVLESPHNSRLADRPGIPLLRLLDKRWDLVLFLLPPAVLLMLAAALALLGGASRWDPALWAALVLVMAVLLHVCVLGTAAVWTTTVRWILGLSVRDRRDWSVAEELRFQHWSMSLCHCADPALAHGLLGEITERLRGLVRAQMMGAVEDLRVRPRMVEVNEPLLCLLDGATTYAMRDVMRKSIGEDPDGVTFLATGSRTDARGRKIAMSGFDGLLVLMGAGLVFLIEAYVLAGWERDECLLDCAGRPATYESALRWLAWRTIFVTPPDLAPLTSKAWVLGWLNAVMAIVVVLLVLVVGWRTSAARKERVDNFRRRMEPVLGTSSVLIMVATNEERDAVIRSVTRVTGVEPLRRHLEHHTVFELGVVSRSRVLLAQTRPAAVDPGGAQLTAKSLIDQLGPDYLLLTGICYGLREGEQQLGDILVCTQLRGIDHKKIIEPTWGTEIEISRGERVAPSVTLLDRCQSARLAKDGPRVHYGVMLSGSLLLNSPTARQSLINANPDAIGGEMEGIGVYAAAAKEKVDWIVVKAICDWGMCKNDDWHEIAARNAAEFVRDVLLNGGLDQPPLRSV